METALGENSRPQRAARRRDGDDEMTARELDDLLEETEHERDIAIMRAEAAEARAAAKSELIDSILATWEPMAERAELIEWRDAGAVEIEELTTERNELARKLEQAQQALRSIEDRAGRAALVQNRSVGIIKQTCKIIADKAKAAMTA